MSDEILKKLTAEDNKTFEAFVERRVREAGANNSDMAKLDVLKDIQTAVKRDGLTPTPDGVSYVKRKAVNWTDPATVAAVQSTAEGKSPSRAGRGNNKEMLQGILILAVGLMAAFYFLWPSGGDKKNRKEEMAEVTPTEESLDETKDPAATVTPVATLESELLASIVDSSGVSTELVVPRTLEVKGITYVIQPTKIKAGDWTMPDEERVASWIYGTSINYILGVEATGGNKEVMAALAPGDELLLRMSTGPSFRFAFADVVRVAPQASEIFRQNHPGLTLVLMSDTEQATRVVVRANYIPESETGLVAQGTEAKAAVGESVVLDQVVRLTNLGNRILFMPAVPPGYVYMAVEYRIENGGSMPLVTSSFGHHIEVDGITYPVVSVPHESNPYPNLPEMLQPGSVFTTTAVYAVPEINVQDLTWEFSPSPAGEKVRISLPPYLGRIKPVVEVKDSTIASGNLMVTFVISAGLRSLELTPADIQVQGGAFSPIGNYFPWQVAAGTTGEFTLVLTSDKNGRTIVTLLEQGFELVYQASS